MGRASSAGTSSFGDCRRRSSSRVAAYRHGIRRSLPARSFRCSRVLASRPTVRSPRTITRSCRCLRVCGRNGNRLDHAAHAPIAGTAHSRCYCGCVRISVRSRIGKDGKEPSSFCLGRCELFVTAIIERSGASNARRFQVRVADGRRFVIRHQADADRWELAAVYAPSSPRRSAVSAITSAASQETRPLSRSGFRSTTGR